MGKVNCPCGNQISDVASPSSDIAWLLSDETLDEIGPVEDWQLVELFDQIWKCRECGRMAVSVKRGAELKWYRPE